MHERYKPANVCIYCGETTASLSDEHVIPLCLNGTLVLPSASCPACAALTSADELEVARHMYGPLRLRDDFRSRRKKRRPESMAFHILDVAGVFREVNIPVRAMPVLIPVLILPKPGIVTGAAPHDRNPPMRLQLIESRPILEKEVLTKDEIERIKYSARVPWGALCRVLAKIAHSYTYAHFRGSGYQALLNPILLRKSGHLAHYVGGYDGEPLQHTIEVGITPIDNETYIYVNVLLMPRLPVYQIIAGRVTDIDELLRAFEGHKTDETRPYV